MTYSHYADPFISVNGLLNRWWQCQPVLVATTVWVNPPPWFS